MTKYKVFIFKPGSAQQLEDLLNDEWEIKSVDTFTEVETADYHEAKYLAISKLVYILFKHD